MILITKVEYVASDRNPHELFRSKYPYGYLSPTDCTEDFSGTVLTELIHGRKYRRCDGTEVVVGATKEVQAILGYEYEAHDNLQKDYRRTLDDLIWAKRALGLKEADFNDACNEIAKIKNANFSTRLKWLFTGVKD